MPGKLQFGLYELDRDAMELSRNGSPVRLQEQPLRVLTALVEKPGEIVTREELRDRIWGKDTYVDFDQSLNKAVNRVREALNDEAAQPQYVETIPRRGYRFIAPVNGLTDNLQLPAPLGPVTVVETPASRPYRFHGPMVLVSAIAVVVTVLGVVTALLWSRPKKSALPEIRHITAAASCCARLSRDGKLLAYVATGSDGLNHIWVQQTGGGEAIQVTRSAAGEIGPDFSPDGTHIAFVSGHGLAIAPTLSGEPKQLPQACGGYPRFSPSGQQILYLGSDGAMTVSIDGGKPMSLSVNRDFNIDRPPLWSPDGEKILFHGASKKELGKTETWWIAPVGMGEPRAIPIKGLTPGGMDTVLAWDWVRDKDGREWIVYSMQDGDVWKLSRVRLSTGGEIEGTPEQLLSGANFLNYSVSLSEDGQLAYTTVNATDLMFEIPIGTRGERAGPILQLPLPNEGDYRSPAVSRDGRSVVYNTSILNKTNVFRVRDLKSGVDRILDDKGRQPRNGGEATISPDGSKVIFYRDCTSGRSKDGGAPPCGFLISVAGGEPRQVCESCTPRGFSSDGTLALVEKYTPTRAEPDRIDALDLASGNESEFLKPQDRAVYHAFFSWDDRWVVFKRLMEPANLVKDPSLVNAQLMIAPVRGRVAGKESEWIAITGGQYRDDKPQFSPDGNMIYFTSNRDGYLCVWAQRLNPATKRPVGGPFAFEHFHSLDQRYDSSHNYTDSDLSVARDKILVNFPRSRGDIWLTEMEDLVQKPLQRGSASQSDPCFTDNPCAGMSVGSSSDR